MSTAAVQSLRGNRGLAEGLIGFEAVGRAARLVLVSGLNDEIDTQADSWRQQDLALQNMGLDPGVGQVEVEHIPTGHFHEGPHKSFLDAPPEKFPNVSVMAYAMVPAGIQFDQFDTINITLFVETMVIAGPVPEGLDDAYETIVHRRIQRTTEAVHATIKRDPALLGAVNPIQAPPKGGIGNQSWVRKPPGTSDRYLWHGSRLQYTTDRHAHFN